MCKGWQNNMENGKMISPVEMIGSEKSEEQNGTSALERTQEEKYSYESQHIDPYMMMEDECEPRPFIPYEEEDNSFFARKAAENSKEKMSVSTQESSGTPESNQNPYQGYYNIGGTGANIFSATSAEMQNEKQQEDMRSINMAQCKSNIRLNEYARKMDLQTCKEEQAKEKRLSQCEVMRIDENGYISVQTENLSVYATPRKGCRFQFLEAAVFENVENPGDRILFIKVLLPGNSVASVYLDMYRAGNGKYVENKFAQAGAEILGCSLVKRKEYALMLVKKILESQEKTIWIPERRGWYLDCENNIQFYDGDVQWEDLIRYAK